MTALLSFLMFNFIADNLTIELSCKMEFITVKKEPKCTNNFDDQIFAEEEIKVSSNSNTKSLCICY